jgi:predicted Fe-S protein YdhL (DUF1289 family)
MQVVAMESCGVAYYRNKQRTTIRIFRDSVENKQIKPAGGALSQDHGPDYSASPCINVCVMNAASGLCDGCLRTLDEIAAWSCASDEQKRRIWLQIRQRRAAA